MGRVGHFRIARTFFGRSRWNPHLRSDLREGVKLKMDQHATHDLVPVVRRDCDLSRIKTSRIRGNASLIVIRVAIRNRMYARNTISRLEPRKCLFVDLSNLKRWRRPLQVDVSVTSTNWNWGASLRRKGARAVQLNFESRHGSLPLFPSGSNTVGVQCRVVDLPARKGPTRVFLLLARGVSPLAAPRCNNNSSTPFLNSRWPTQGS
jgi:hypothetical protein